MSHKITDSEIHINNTIIIPKRNVEQLFKEDLLNVSMQDLFDMFSNLWGVPSNFKDYLIYKINLYDKSKEINNFYYNGNTYWFDKNTRLGLMNLLSCGGDSIQVVLEDEIVTFDSDKFKKFLQNLELYASQCYITTAKHLNSVQKLEKLEDIINYDYTLGYPDKITLSNE